MSAGPQITWDDAPKAAPPQVQWDEEKKAPEKKSFWQKGWEGLTQKLPRPAGGGEESELGSTSSEGLSELGGLARESAQKSQQEDLHKLATTGQQPSFTRKALQYAKNVGASSLNTAAGITSPTSQAIGAGMMVAPEIVGPALIAHGTYTAGKNLPEAVHGNPEAAEASLSGAAEAAGGGAVTGGALAPGTPKTFTRNALTTARNTLIKGEPPAVMVPEAQKAFTQAIQPGVNIPRAQESIQIAGPRMKQVMEDEGLNLRREKGENAVPVTKKALDVIKTAKQQVHAAIEDRLGPVAELSPNTSPVADAMEQSISGRTARQFPAAAKAIRERADSYRGNLSLREIENSIQDANNELRNYYKRPGGTDSPTPAHMDATLAEVKTLRNLLDEKVESLSGAGVKDLKREYGALRDVERATAKQHAIATRTKEGGLWEGLAYMHAAGDLLSGNALGAARGAGAITVGRVLKTLRDPNYLIEQSFHGPNAFKAAEPIAPHAGPPAPRGLLPAPPTPGTPAGFSQQDTSGPVRGGRYTTPAALIPERPTTPATFLREIPRAAREAVQGPKALLPAPPTTTIPPAVEEKFATESTGRAADESKLGPRGQGGVRIPIKGMLPAAREAMGTPPATPKPAPKYTPSEKAATMSEPLKDYGKEFNAQQRQEELKRYRDIEANPKATKEEKAIAASRMRDTEDPNFIANALKAAKEPEPVETKIKGITAEEPKAARPKREVARPIESRFSDEEILNAEGLLASEAGAMASADRPGVYYDQTEPGDVYTPRYAPEGGRAGGNWRGVKSGRDMYPFMREHPEMNPDAVLKALRNKDSAFYKRAMEAAIEFGRRGKAGEAAEPETVEPGAEEFPFGAKAEEKTPEGVLPGMGEHVRAQEAGAGKVKAEELTREANTPRSVDQAAARMETHSPLFRGTEASPQNEMFGKQAPNKAPNGAGKETYWKGDKAEYTGKKERIAGGTFYELRLTEGHRKGEMVYTSKAPAS